MITVGKHTYGVEHIKIKYAREDINLTIGKFCSIADNITIYQAGDHHADWITTYPFSHKEIFDKSPKTNHATTRGDIIIGNDVWIGDNVTIMSGVQIGDGAIIGANSHVISNIKPYSVVGGNPAQLYYFRFRQIIIEELLKIRWWDWPEEKINENTLILCSDNYDKIIDL